MKEETVSYKAIFITLGVLLLLGIGFSGNSPQLAPQSCTDTDLGTLAEIRGTTCVGDNCISDYCGKRGTDSLVEYFCGENGHESVTITCPYGCDGGECVQEEKPISCASDRDCDTDDKQAYCNAAGEACTRSVQHSCEFAGTPDAFCAPQLAFSCTACDAGTRCDAGACVSSR